MKNFLIFLIGILIDCCLFDCYFFYLIMAFGIFCKFVGHLDFVCNRVICRFLWNWIPHMKTWSRQKALFCYSLWLSDLTLRFSFVLHVYIWRSIMKSAMNIYSIFMKPIWQTDQTDRQTDLCKHWSNRFSICFIFCCHCSIPRISSTMGHWV